MQKVCVNLPIQATFKKIWTNDVIADNATPTINGLRMLKWYSSHPSRILIFPIMHIMPVHISRICEVSFIRKKHMTQKWDIYSYFSTNPITEIKTQKYGWNLCRCKILNTDRWQIPLFFSIFLPLACGFSAAKAKIAATLFSIPISNNVWLVFVSLYRSDRNSQLIAWKSCAILVAYPDNEPHTNLGSLCNVYRIAPAPLIYQNILENLSFSRSDVLTLEGNAWVTDISTENA